MVLWVLERRDNELCWLRPVGLTNQIILGGGLMRTGLN